MKKNYIFSVTWALLLGTLTYGQAPKFKLDFEGLNPLLNLPAGVTNVNATNTIKVKNTTNYAAIPNAVQNKPGGGKELFLDFQGYLKINVPTPSAGFSLAYDYRRNDTNDDWYLGFLSFIGNNGSGNILERLLISQWDGKLDFGSIASANSPISFNTNYKIVVTCNAAGDLKVYVDNVLRLSVPNTTSGKNIQTWTNTSLLLSFKGESFDGTNVTPESEYATNARDTRAFVDNVELYERELTPAEITNINFPPYAQAPKFFLDFEGVNPLSNLPAGVSNVNGTNTVRVKNTTNYPAIPNAVQSDGTGGKELFLDFHGYLKMNVTPSTGFSLAFDYRKSPEDADWYLGFLTIIGNNGSGNVLEQILLKKYWESLFDFSGTESSGVSQNFETEAKIVITCSKTGGIKIYVNSVKVLDRPNSSSGKNFHTWTNASLLLSFKGNSFDGTNVTPENEYTLNARDTRAYVDNIALYEGEISAAEVAFLSTNGNNSLSLEDQKVLSKERVGMYPNPVNDVVKFSSPEVKSVAIYTIMGNKVMTKEIINSSVDLRGLNSGVYIVNCFDIEGKKMNTIKLIKL
jgi:hypothetical protein